MLIPGMTSVTFRSLSRKEIVDLAKAADLRTIEWGGDIHVPHGSLSAAKEAYLLTSAAGLTVSSYGSYYEAGVLDPKLPFEKVLDSAKELHAPMIRVWAGNKASADADASWREQVIMDCQNISRMASSSGIGISFESHENTLTDTPDSARRLLCDLDLYNVRTYWQISMERPVSFALPELDCILHWLTNLHVFYYLDNEQSALEVGHNVWTEIMKRAAENGEDHNCLLEFVKNESMQQFFADAKELNTLCRGGNQ